MRYRKTILKIQNCLQKTSKKSDKLKNFKFSRICAGGEVNKSNCDGDGGNPLVCNITGQWYVVGLASWAPTDQSEFINQGVIRGRDKFKKNKFKSRFK